MIEQIRYHIDNLFARGTWALLLVLGVAMLVLIGVITIAMVVIGVSPGEGATLWDSIWTIFTYTFDPSGVPYQDGVWTYRLLMLVASLGGIFILSLLVGILANGFADAVQTLRKGKSIVVETDHTLVLGWGDQVFSVLHELIVANENVKGACVVILADMDKVDMEDAIRARIADTKTTRIVCRSGSPIDVSDLAIVRPSLAKSIIILDPQTEDPEVGDAYTVKTLLALQRLDSAHSKAAVVATMRSEANVRVAELVTGGRANIIPSEVMISQIITQTCRQPGLSLVYAELLDFDGDELYVHNEPKLVGKTFAESLLWYEESCLVGLKYANGQLKLNPPLDSVIAEGDSIIALSADDDTIVLRDAPAHVQTHQVATGIQRARAVERILVLGWNERGRFIIRELDEYVIDGTEIVVVDHIDRSADVATIQNSVQHSRPSFIQARTTSRDVLDSLNVASFNSVIVLADTSLDVQHADARTIMTLIHLRDITAGAHSVNIVTEMLDERNRSLASTDGLNDFIISNTIISLLLTQIAENQDLHAVFRDLFDAAGSELYLKPITEYIAESTQYSMATLVYAATQRSEIAIGLKCKVNGEWAVRLNIPKSETLSFSEEDLVVVIAEN